MELTRDIQVGTKVWDPKSPPNVPIHEITGICERGIFTRPVGHFPNGTGHSFLPWERTHNIEVAI